MARDSLWSWLKASGSRRESHWPPWISAKSRRPGDSVVVVVTVVNAAELTVVTPLIGDGSGDNNGGDCKTVSAGSPIIDVEQ